MVEQNQSAADSAAWQEVAGLVFLERARAAADDLAGLHLIEPEFLSDAVNLFLSPRRAP